MILAAAADGSIRGPTRSGEPGRCPQCQQPVRGKHGQIVIAHWAHLAATDCDPWTEPESDWHRAWKRWFLERGDRIEVTLDHGGQRHRADVITTQGVIVELQHRYLPIDQIDEREQFYGEAMCWLYDARAWIDRLHLGRHNLMTGWHGVWFKNGGKSLALHKRPVMFDLGDRLARVRLGLVERGEWLSEDTWMTTGERLIGQIKYLKWQRPEMEKT